MSRCHFMDLYRPDHVFDADKVPDYVQVYIDNKCVKADREDGAGPGQVHMHPEEGYDVLRRYYVPADGKEHSVRLRYCVEGAQGQVATLPLPEPIKGNAPAETAAPPVDRRDYLDPTSTVQTALDHAFAQGREAMRATMHADQDRRQLATALVGQSERYADRTVDTVGAAYDRAHQAQAEANARIERVTAQAFDLVRGGMEAERARAEQADRRAEQARRDSAPMAVAMRALQAGKMVLDMAGGIDGVKEKIGSALGVAASVTGASAGGAERIAEVFAAVADKGLDTYERAMMMKATIDDVTGANASTSSAQLDVDDDDDDDDDGADE